MIIQIGDGKNEVQFITTHKELMKIKERNDKIVIKANSALNVFEAPEKIMEEARQAKQ